MIHSNKYQLKDYQQKAFDRFGEVLNLLKYEERLNNFKHNPTDPDAVEELSNGNYNIQLKSPTGSGKTVLIAKVITEHLKNYVTIVFSPGAGGLSEQTYQRIKDVSGNSPKIKQMSESEFRLLPVAGDCFVANWEQLTTRDNKTGQYKNLLVRDGDSYGFFDFVSNVGIQRLPVAIIIDESHYGKNQATSIQNFLKDITIALGYKPTTIELSATPLLGENTVSINITPGSVIREGLMRKSVRLNPANVIQAANKLSAEQRANIQIENFLIEGAVQLQKSLDAEYIKEDAHEMIDGKKVFYHSLIGLQLPNGSVGNEALARVEAQLRDKYGYTRDNGQLVVYMSTDKSTPLAGISSPDSPAKVLIYKQAIATGWDCPRAQILLGFRHITSKIFTEQNLGRFVRTTQRKHYNNELLDYAYVISNVGDLGQANFGEDVTNILNYEKESLLRKDSTGRIALSSFNKANLPISHYARTGQSVIPQPVLWRAFEQQAIDMNLTKSLVYKASAGLGGSSIKGGEKDLSESDSEFVAVSETKEFSTEDEKQRNDFVNHLLNIVTEDNRDYGNNAQIAEKLVRVATRFYIQAVKGGRSDSTYTGTLKQIEEIVKNEILQKSRLGQPDWNDFAVEQLSLIESNLDALAQVIRATLKSEALKKYIKIPEGEVSENQEARKYTQDGIFCINLTNAFWSNPTEDSSVSENMTPFYATKLATLDGREASVREEAKLSSPEEEFENGFLYSIRDHLCFFYKSPENSRTAFRIGVSTPGGKTTNFYPDYLLEIRHHLEESDEYSIMPSIVEIKDEEEISKSDGDLEHITNAKAKALAEYAEEHNIKACVAYEAKKGRKVSEWRAITGVNSEGKYTTELLEDYLTQQ